MLLLVLLPIAIAAILMAIVTQLSEENALLFVLTISWLALLALLVGPDRLN